MPLSLELPCIMTCKRTFVETSDEPGVNSGSGIAKLYQEELRRIADRDPLHDLTEQVRASENS